MLSTNCKHVEKVSCNHAIEKHSQPSVATTRLASCTFCQNVLYFYRNAPKLCVEF